MEVPSGRQRPASLGEGMQVLVPPPRRALALGAAALGLPFAGTFVARTSVGFRAALPAHSLLLLVPLGLNFWFHSSPARVRTTRARRKVIPRLTFTTTLAAVIRTSHFGILFSYLRRLGRAGGAVQRGGGGSDPSPGLHRHRHRDRRSGGGARPSESRRSPDRVARGPRGLDRRARERRAPRLARIQFTARDPTLRSVRRSRPRRSAAGRPRCGRRARTASRVAARALQSGKLESVRVTVAVARLAPADRIQNFLFLASSNVVRTMRLRSVSLMPQVSTRCNRVTPPTPPYCVAKRCGMPQWTSIGRRTRRRARTRSYCRGGARRR